ncbi:MAG: response regulator transcription factor [Elusimicrobia bacterium]|nr:response regulator transcription factor [Elusimicrobiota bacterium]
MSKKILVADDDELIRNMLQETLLAEGYQVKTASDGHQALKACSQQVFDLLILDVEMPQLDGYHLAQTLQSREGVPTPKIIILTGRDTQKEKGAALWAGAHRILQKPCDIELLIAEVKKILPP